MSTDCTCLWSEENDWPDPIVKKADCPVHGSTDLQDKIAKDCPVCGGDGMEYTNDGESPMHTKPCLECKRVEQLVTEARLGELEWVKSVSAKWGIPSYEIMAKTMDERVKALQERKTV